MINLENSVDFCLKSYDDMKRANDATVTRITQQEEQNADLHKKVQTAMSEVEICNNIPDATVFYSTG